MPVEKGSLNERRQRELEELANRQQAEEDAKKRKQQMVIVLLLVGLLVAILTQPKKADKTNTASTNAELAISDVAKTTAVASDLSIDTLLLRINQLSRLSVETADSKDLFPFKQAKLVDTVIEQKPKEQVRVVAIYGTSADSRAALVGKSASNARSQIVRKGEALPDGRTVLRVAPTGVEVAE